jgi:2-oxo-4-hydroxy-4-carboxy-5-ureidoimidazoline decarboxylase
MAAAPIPLADVNRMDDEAFVAAFGDVAEHAPWVAERAAKARPYASREAMAGAFLDAVLDAGDAFKLALVRAHPDLAGRAKRADLAPDSRREQAGAGLDRLTAEELARFTALNDAYRARFGFPFIFAVRGADKGQVLAAFQKRLGNEHEQELATAIRQVGNIIRFRIDDRVAP